MALSVIFRTLIYLSFHVTILQSPSQYLSVWNRDSEGMASIKYVTLPSSLTFGEMSTDTKCILSQLCHAVTLVSDEGRCKVVECVLVQHG